MSLSSMFNVEEWFTCYQLNEKHVICTGPFKTAMEADDATLENQKRKNSTLLPVCSLFPVFIQRHLLQFKYNAIFRPNLKVTVKSTTL